MVRKVVSFPISLSLVYKGNIFFGGPEIGCSGRYVLVGMSCCLLHEGVGLEGTVTGWS